MKVWVVLCCDRHYDPDPRLFVASEDAFSEAQAFADEYEIDPEDEDRKPMHLKPEDNEGIVFTRSLSEEGDSVTIYQRDLGT